MSELLTMQDLANGHLDVKALGEAANGDENTIVTTRTGNTYPSAERAINIMFQNGGLPAKPFQTKALMTASALVDGDYAMVTNDTVNNGLYVKTAGAWVKSSYDQLSNSKNYTDNLFNSIAELSNTSSLDTHQFIDSDYNIVARISRDGGLYITGLNDSVQEEFKNTAKYTDTAISNLGISQNKLADIVTFLDASDEVIVRVASNGDIYLVGLEQSVQELLLEIPSQIVDFLEESGLYNDGNSNLATITDKNGDVVVNLDKDGRVFIPDLENDIATSINNLKLGIGYNQDSKDFSHLRDYRHSYITPVNNLLSALHNSGPFTKAPVPLYQYPQNYTIGTEWVTNLQTFGKSDSIRLTVDSPYRTDSGMVHPNVMEFYSNFRGYRYLAAINPYHLTNEAEENPCIYGTNDLINYELLSGFPQPLDNRPQPVGSSGHNSDNVLSYDPRTGELLCIWRQTQRSPSDYGPRYDSFWVRKTKDGYNWTEKERIYVTYKNPEGAAGLSPSFIYDIVSGYWYLYLSTTNGLNTLKVFRSKELNEDTWELIQVIETPYKLWHAEVKYIGDKIVIIAVGYQSDIDLFVGVSSNFLDFTWSSSLYTGSHIYKASFVPEFDSQDNLALKILWTTDQNESEVGEKWRMYLTTTNFVNADFNYKS